MKVRLKWLKVSPCVLSQRLKPQHPQCDLQVEPKHKGNAVLSNMLSKICFSGDKLSYALLFCPVLSYPVPFFPVLSCVVSYVGLCHFPVLPFHVLSWCLLSTFPSFPVCPVLSLFHPILFGLFLSFNLLLPSHFQSGPFLFFSFYFLSCPFVSCCFSWSSILTFLVLFGPFSSCPSLSSTLLSCPIVSLPVLSSCVLCCCLLYFPPPVSSSLVLCTVPLALWGEPDCVHVRSIWLGVLLRRAVPLSGGRQHLRRSDHHHQLYRLHLAERQLPGLPEHPGQCLWSFGCRYDGSRSEFRIWLQDCDPQIILLTKTLLLLFHLPSWKKLLCVELQNIHFDALQWWFKGRHRQSTPIPGERLNQHSLRFVSFIQQQKLRTS